MRRSSSEQDTSQVNHLPAPKRRSLPVRTNRAMGLHWAHWLIIGMSLILTLSAWHITKGQEEEKSLLKFNREAEQVVSLIRERMKHYEDALRSGAAYLKAQDYEVTSEEWRSYSDYIDIVDTYPGINGIGIIWEVPKSQIPRFQKKQRATRPDFTIYPSHKNHTSLPITYIEPYESNKQAIGLDVAHEDNRLMAALKSKVSGTPQVTGPIILVQDNQKTPGFLFYYPVYRSERDDDSDNNVVNKDDFIGFVYAPFIFKNFMEGLLSQEKRHVSISLTDGDDLLFNEISETDQLTSQPTHQKVVSKYFYGRHWSFLIQTTDSFDQSTKSF